jgi:hypothetical protein
MIKDLIKLFVLSFVFTVVVFFVKTTFFTDKSEIIEDNYIDPVIVVTDKQRADLLINKLKDKKFKNLNSANKYYFVYIPSNIKDKLKSFKNNIKKYIDNENVNKFISDLRINFYKESIDRR